MHNSTCKILTQDSLSQQSQASGSWEGRWRAASQPWKSGMLWGNGNLSALGTMPHLCVILPDWNTHGSMVACLSVLRNSIPHCRKILLPSWCCFSFLKLNFILCCCIPLFYSSLMSTHSAACLFFYFFPIHVIALIDPYVTPHREVIFANIKRQPWPSII